MHHGHGRGNGMASYSSSSFMSMTSGPDGRPQIYQASSSTQAGPGGVVETKKSVQDSRTGIKKMAIGHHIGERGHIIEREQNYHEGTQEEREDFINLEEEEAEDFNREFVQKSRRNQPTIQCIDGPQGGGGRREMLAITNGPSAASTSGYVIFLTFLRLLVCTVVVGLLFSYVDEMTSAWQEMVSVC